MRHPKYCDGDRKPTMEALEVRNGLSPDGLDAAEELARLEWERDRLAPCVDLREALDALHRTMVFSSKDWSTARDLAYMYGIVCGWDGRSLKELAARFLWNEDDVATLRRLHRAYMAAIKERDPSVVMGSTGQAEKPHGRRRPTLRSRIAEALRILGTEDERRREFVGFGALGLQRRMREAVAALVGKETLA